MRSILWFTAVVAVTSGVVEAFVVVGNTARRCFINQQQLCSTATSTSAFSEGAVARVELESSAGAFAGAGEVQVDMNEYNLMSLEQIAEEWTATVVAASSMQEAGVYLGARNEKENFVDTLKVVVPRKVGQGLGIELLELAGGREDGLGITIASGLVPGGVSENSGILPGDSISKLSIRRTKRISTPVEADGGLFEAEQEEITAVATECLGYDATVDAILSLPQPADEQEALESEFVLTIKRLRRKPKVSLTLQYPPWQNEPEVKLELFAGENLRRAMLARGVKLNDALARRFDNGGSGDCGADGTCATCAVSVVRGQELLNPPKQTEKQMVTDVHARWRLACKAVVGHGMREGELVLKVNPKQWDE